MTNRGPIRILVIAVAVFAIVSGYNIFRSREVSSHLECFNQMYAVEGAKEQFAIEHEGRAPASIDELIPTYLEHLPMCPSGGTIHLGDMQTPASCSFKGHAPDRPEAAGESTEPAESPEPPQ